MKIIQAPFNLQLPLFSFSFFWRWSLLIDLSDTTFTMLELSSQLVKSIYSFFESSSRPVKGVPVYKISNDIFLDHIFPHLLVEDVCRLRQVPKRAYFKHKVLYWHNLFRQTGSFTC